MPDINTIKSVAIELGKKYGADRICLFGSYARGTMTEDSDIDIRIDKGAIRGLQFAGLACEFEDAFGKSVDLISTNGMDADFLEQIEKEEILLYERK